MSTHDLGRMRGCSPAITFLVIALFSAAACTLGERAPKEQAATPLAAGANLLLITMDTVRADHLPPYGYPGVSTPAITELAAQGIRFAEAFTPVPMTLPSHASMFTGLLPFHHGVRDNGGFRLDARNRTLADALQQAGYHTAAFVSAFVLHSRWGLAHGFGEYGDQFTVSRGDLSAMARVQRSASETWAHAKPWLERHASDRFFLWLHFYDPHSPYAPPEPFRSTYAARPYDGEIAYVDSVISQAIGLLRARGILDRTLVVLLSDHGEGLGEHDEDEHGLLTYDSTLHVPWIVRLPKGDLGGRVVDAPVSLVDVYPTVLDLLGLAPVTDIDGVSRARMFRQATTDSDALYAESYYPRLRLNWSELTSVRLGGLKYVRAPQPELYDYRRDPGETKNLASSRPDAVARLDQVLTRMTNTTDATVPPTTTDPHTARDLRALGYVSGSAGLSAPSEGRANPAQKTSVYRQLVRAQQQLEEGHDRIGIELLSEVLRADPALPPAHRALRDDWIGRRHFDEGTSWLRRRLAQHPDDVQLWIDLASVEQAAGRPDAAMRAVNAALQRDPANIDALTLAGQALRSTGQFDGALDAFSRAVARSSDVSLRMEQAQTLFSMKRFADAEAAARLLLRTDPSTTGAHYLLAQIAETRGDSAMAEREYGDEIAISPWEYRARFNLAVLLGREGRRTEQITQLEAIPAIAPEFVEVNFYLAKALLDSGDRSRFPAAIAAAQRGLQGAPLSPTAPLGHYVLADVYRAEGRTEEANTEYAAGQALESRVDHKPTEHRH